MKTLRTFLFGLTLALLPLSALAADLGGPKPAAAAVEPEPAFAHYDWSGAYVGGQMAFDVNNTSARVAGLHLGYRKQADMIVGGLELSATLPLGSAPKTLADIEGQASLSAAGTLGIAFGRVLVYGKGGYVRAAGLDGLTYGAGVAYGITHNLILGVDLMRTDYGTLSGSSFAAESRTDAAVGRLSWRF